MDYYNEIKLELINNETYKRVKDYSKNRSDLMTYYNVGKLLIEAQGGEDRAKYGDGLIKQYSERLTLELGKGYTVTNLKYMRQFYVFLKKGHTLCDALTWSHYRQLLYIENSGEINYYINISVSQNLSVRELINKIKNCEYERLDEDTKRKLLVDSNNSNNQINDFIKHPVIIRNKYNYQEISERILKQLILEDISSFMQELGNGFSFIKSEFKIKIGDKFNYIDLLMFNYIYNCFVVVELKITEIKAEYIGQVKKYMNYVDKNIKRIGQDNTIGIIICKKDDKFVMEYCSDDRIYRTTYELVCI